MKSKKEAKSYTNKRLFIYTAIIGILNIALLMFLSSYIIKESDLRIYFSILMCFLILTTCAVCLFIYKIKFIINDDEIIFHIKTSSEQKEYNGYNTKGLSINIYDIEMISFIPHYRTERALFKLKDGKSFEVLFIIFGEKKSNEILADLKELASKINESVVRK